jgi:hypothetical protein
MPWPWHVADVAIALVFEGTMESTRTMPISETPGTCGFSSRIVFSPASQTQRVDNLRVHHDAYLAISVHWHKSVMWCTSTILTNNGKCMQMHIPIHTQQTLLQSTVLFDNQKIIWGEVCLHFWSCNATSVLSNCSTQPALHSPIHVHNPSRFWRDIPIRFVWLSLAASSAGRNFCKSRTVHY